MALLCEQCLLSGSRLASRTADTAVAPTLNDKIRCADLNGGIVGTIVVWPEVVSPVAIAVD